MRIGDHQPPIQGPGPTVTFQLQAKSNLLFRVNAPVQHPAYSLSTPESSILPPERSTTAFFHIISFSRMNPDDFRLHPSQ